MIYAHDTVTSAVGGENLVCMIVLQMSQWLEQASQ